MDFRLYNHERDHIDGKRIWREVGWIDESEREEAGFDEFLSSGPTYVGLIRGRPECLVATVPGTLLYQKRELGLSAVTAVTTGRIARKQGIATRLTAAALARAAEAGLHVAGLGVFDQGFYNRLGFGTGSPVRLFSFDPAQLKVHGRPRVPHQFDVSHAAAIHASRLSRLRTHGNCNLLPTAATRAEMIWTEGGFGLGYYDDSGEISHHIWIQPKGDRGPHSIEWLSYRTPEQFIELMQVVRTLGDQVHTVRIDEPPAVAFDDLISQPFKQLRMTRQSPHEASMKSLAFTQVRILDLEACVQAVSLPHGLQLDLELVIHDPVEDLLPEDSPWRGIGGSYHLHLGETSRLEPAGSSASLPRLEASAGAFSRLWFGVRPASVIAVTDDLVADASLLSRLDALVSPGIPQFGWPY